MDGEEQEKPDHSPFAHVMLSLPTDTLQAATTQKGEPGSSVGVNLHLFNGSVVPLELSENMPIAELTAKVLEAALARGFQAASFVKDARLHFRGLPLMTPAFPLPRVSTIKDAGITQHVPAAERVLTVEHMPAIFCCRGARFVAPTVETLKNMLRLEVALRKSEHALLAMGVLVDSGTGDWMDIVKSMIQLPVTRAFGYRGPVAEEMALDCMLNARHNYPNEPSFVEIPFYVKYNRARDGPLVVGETAPVVEMCPLDDIKKHVPLYDLGKAIPVLNALYETHESDKVSVRMIYIEEAHATDEWPVGSKLYAYKQTKELEERIAVAAATQALGLKVPIFLDIPPTNKFSELYCPWPARFYIIDADGALLVKPKPVNGTYDTGVIWDTLSRLNL